MFDLISIGDSVIDTFVPLTEAEVLDKDGKPLLAMPYGIKVPVEQSQSVVGGNASNNAIGSSRLGLNTAIYTNVGKKDDDEADDRIKNKLKKEGVDIRYVIEAEDLPSGHHIVLSFKGERTILIHHQPWKYKLPDLEKSKWVYFTSLSESYLESNIVEQVVNYLQRSGAKLAFQPGTFQIKSGLKKNAKLLSASEVLIFNLEEAKLLLGTDEVDVKKLLEKIRDLGPKYVVITDGRKGSYGFDGQTFFQIGLFPGEAVEATGAGDAYATGLVAGLIHGESLEESMRWGGANGASVVEQVGSTAGLLTHSQLQEKLKENSKIIAKII